jgi:regulator of protease activity HflC (stomatin/prohibitin superfamily)
MATISSLMGFRHLRADPNQFILHFRKGSLIRSGPGLTYWFYPLSAAIAQVPVEDCETTIVLRERTADLQEVAVQCTVVFRFADAIKAAGRANFTISLDSGSWVDKPLDRVAAFWSQRVREPIRSHLARLALHDAVRTGAATVRAALLDTLPQDPELASMGLALVGVQIDQISPPPELTKALEMPTRESIQQKADEAVFARRAIAVEKERAIKENELSTQIELARRQDDLIRRSNANRVLEAQGKADADRARIKAELELQSLAAEGYARDVKLKAEGDAEARRMIGRADADAEAVRAGAWKDVPPDVLVALAAHAAAQKIQSIDHLTLTPDTLGNALAKALHRGESE